jgi:hypothetical protein
MTRTWRSGNVAVVLENKIQGTRSQVLGGWGITEQKILVNNGGTLRKAIAEAD